MKQSLVLSKILLPALVFLAYFAPLLALQAAPSVLYVKPTGDDANSGFSWELAKLTIDGAISAAAPGYTILVTNGTYGAVTQQVYQMTLQSVNGPAVTIIDAEGSSRCVGDVYQGSLDGFTLKNGYSETENGGGAMVGGDGSTTASSTAIPH